MAGEIALGIAVLWVLLALIVGKHASNSGKSGIFWGITTFIFGILGLIVYAISLASAGNELSSGSGTRSCPECGANNVYSANYCHNCSYEFSDEDTSEFIDKNKIGAKYYCANCDSVVEKSADRCPECGGVFT